MRRCVGELGDGRRQRRVEGEAYVEVNVEIAGTTELAIAHLEGHGHFIVLVEFFVEAFARVGFELDVVC